MRYIDKTNEKSRSAADVLHQWRDNYVNAGGEKFSELCKKDSINAEVLWTYLQDKEALRNSLHQEQGGICCYCCREIIGKSIIEHFKAKSGNKCENTYNYGNLLLSCNGDAAELKSYNVIRGETWESIAEKRKIEVSELKKVNLNKKDSPLSHGDKIKLPHIPNPEHCDASKGGKTIEIINPVNDKSCEEKFIYTSEGLIEEADKMNNLATETIKTLNSPLLKEKRKKVWEEFRNAIGEGADLIELKNYYEEPSNLSVVYRYYLKSQFGL